MLIQDFQRMFPRVKLWPEYAPLLEAAMQEFEITAPYRMAAFLANVSHESEGLVTWSERGGRMKSYSPYWGRGPIQLTHRDTYAACGNALGVDLVNRPDLVLTASVGFRSSAWFWRTKGLNEIADRIHADAQALNEIAGRVHGCLKMRFCLCRSSRRLAYDRIFPVVSEPTVPYV